MVDTTEAYEELPYESQTIEWTAPERLALASLLHGGPRPPTSGYRYLELGCGTGHNLRALAYYRRDAQFVGLDGAAVHIDKARADADALELSNVEYVHTDFSVAAEHLSGQSFDYIVAHGVFSWVPPEVAVDLLALMARHLQPQGLAYVGYNTRPGWNVRGLVREHLMGQTAGIDGIQARAERARAIAAQFEQTLTSSESPYSQLLAKEFRLVAQMDTPYVAHEYLAPHNHPYWRSEFAGLAEAAGFEVVADADFYSATGRLPEGIETWLKEGDLAGPSVDDTADLLCYRQHHCPVLALRPLQRRDPAVEEFGELFVASALQPEPKAVSYAEGDKFLSPTGGEITVFEEGLSGLLRQLGPLYPRGVRLREAVDDVAGLIDDLRLLARQGVVDLRLIEPEGIAGEVELNALHRLELQQGNVVTSPVHTRRSSS